MATYLRLLCSLFILTNASAQSNFDNSTEKLACHYKSNDGVVMLGGTRIDSLSSETAAIDLLLAPYTQFVTSSFDMRVSAVGGISKIDMIIWTNKVSASSNNIPDTIISEHLNLVPSYQGIAATIGSNEIYEVEFDLPTPLTFTSDANDSIYWINIIAYPNNAGEDVWWSPSTASEDNALAIFPDGGSDWILTGTEQPYTTPRESVYGFYGSCESTVGVEQNELYDFEIFVNAFENELEIHPNGNNNQFECTIVDVFGHEVHSATALKGDYSTSIGDFASGVYLVWLRFENGQSLCRSFMK